MEPDRLLLNANGVELSRVWGEPHAHRRRRVADTDAHRRGFVANAAHRERVHARGNVGDGETTVVERDHTARARGEHDLRVLDGDSGLVHDGASNGTDALRRAGCRGEEQGASGEQGAGSVWEFHDPMEREDYSTPKRASTSARRAIAGDVPYRVTQIPAAAHPKRTASSTSLPSASATASPPLNASPAPVVSNTGPASIAFTCSTVFAVLMSAPPSPSVTITCRAPRESSTSAACSAVSGLDTITPVSFV